MSAFLYLDESGTPVCSYCRDDETIFQAPLGCRIDLETFFQNAEICANCALLMSTVMHFASRLLLSDSHPDRAWHIAGRGSHTLVLGYSDEPYQTQYTCDTRELPFFFYLEPGSLPFQDLRVLPHMCDDTSSAVSTTIASGWVKTCCSDHESCPDDPGPGNLPKRTVFIAGERDVRLSLNDAESTGVYACLSHCWGKKPQSVVTTRETLAAHQLGIPWSSLSKTFQDALQFAWQLGICHLWIESLCIVQGDADDWAEQSYEMANIHSNAFLTLAATASSDGCGGCFRQNTEHTWQRYEVPNDAWLEWANPSTPGETAHVFPRLCARVSFHGHQQPLVDRGWVFQEQLLSPRVLYFNEHELAWTCRCHPTGTCECQQEELFRRGDTEGSTSDEWAEIVQRFTRRELTYPSDKLPAMSGIAREFASVRRRGDGHIARLSNWTQTSSSSDYVVEREKVPLGRYAAGLWEGRLKRHLTWYNHSTRLGWDPPCSRRPDTYRAPTWSWASIDDRAYMNWYSWDNEPNNMVEVLQIDCTPANHRNIYGHVVDGFLELSVRLIQLSVRVNRDGHNGNVEWQVITPSDGFTSISNLAFDVLETFEEAENQEMGLEVFCALLDQPSQFNYDGLTSLVLRPKGCVKDMVFGRVGVAKIKVVNADHDCDGCNGISAPEEHTEKDCPYLSIIPSTIRIE